MSYAPNYAWTGAPTEYNGTGYDGGDSGMFISYLGSPNADYAWHSSQHKQHLLITIES
jgi:hypothetical protein